MLISSSAMADTPVAGCNDKVMKAMNAKAQAKVAYDVAATEQIIKKPDSVLALTCFNNAAGISATSGGAIFSGDFMDSLAPVIGDALQGFYGHFAGAIGAAKANISYDTTLGTSADCNNIQKLWDQVNETGIEPGAPNMTFTQLVNNQVPSEGGEQFKANIAAETQTLNDLKTAVNDLPAVDQDYVPYSPGESVCEYLKKINKDETMSCD